MRKTLLALAVIGLGWLAFLAWPIFTLATLTRAIERGDAPTVIAHVEFPALRNSLTQQIVGTYLRLTGKKVSPLLLGAAGVADTIADPVVGKLVTAEALTDFLRTGWPNAVVPERPPGTVGLSAANIGTAWEIFGSSSYGIRRFEIAVPPSFPPNRRFGLEFRLTQWRWHLVGIRMPEYMQVLLAEMLIKSLQQR
jgi:hypothetical protein